MWRALLVSRTLAFVGRVQEQEFDVATSWGRIRRLTDLWKTGEIVYFGDDENGDPITLWVQKLTSAGRTEAQKDGQFAAAKRRLVLTDDSEDVTLIRAELATAQREQMIEYVISPKMNEAYARAFDDVRSDKEWEEKIVIIERGALTEDGEEPTEEEAKELARVQAQYFGAVEQALEQRVRDLKDEYSSYSDEEIRDEYVDAYRENQAMEAFSRAFQKTQLFLCIRDCHAKNVAPKGEAPRWDHERCTHSQLLSSRADVDQLPDELVAAINDKLSDISMTEAEAGN